MPLNNTGTDLARLLGYTVITPRHKVLKTTTSTILNWGLGSQHVDRRVWDDGDTDTIRFYNKPTSIDVASNKLLTFKCLHNEVPIPDFTESLEIAQSWINSGHKVLSRTLLRSSRGKGIVIARAEEELVNCKLYVKYFKKKIELRVHVVLGEVVHISQKRKLTPSQLEERGITNREPLIRNIDNGYIYSNDISVEENILTEIKVGCIKAMNLLKLDFGAVDVIVNGNDWVILEVNTTPALKGSALTAYVHRFTEILA